MAELPVRFAFADAVRDGEMPLGVFRDWLLDHDESSKCRESFVATVAWWLVDGPYLVADEPIGRVTFEDREPYHYGGYTFAWCNWTQALGGDDDPEDTSELPPVLLRYLAGPAIAQNDDETSGTFKGLTYFAYTTADLANADLSRAAVAWARDRALQTMGVALVC